MGSAGCCKYKKNYSPTAKTLLCDVSLEESVQTEVYPTIAIMKEKMKLKKTNYKILQILNFSLIDKIPIQQMFNNYYHQTFKEQASNQLNFNL